jgi:hypothetical protein
MTAQEGVWRDSLNLNQELFEDRVFCDYFVKGIGFPKEGGFATSKHNMFLSEFCQRTEDGTDYVREDVSAMWNGWKLAIQFSNRMLP